MRKLFGPLFGVFLIAASTALAQEATVITGTVTTKEDGLPYPGATVAIADLELSAKAGRDGKYEFKIPAAVAKGRTVEVRVVAPGLSAKSARVTLAPGVITQDFSMTLGVSAQVTVGSRAAGAEVEKAVPIDILTQKQIEQASPSGEVAQVIQKLVPSCNFPQIGRAPV